MIGRTAGGNPAVLAHHRACKPEQIYFSFLDFLGQILAGESQTENEVHDRNRRNPARLDLIDFLQE